MSWRENWLLALPPRARLAPPMLLAVGGSLLLVWLHSRAATGFGANLTPLVWCVIGLALLVRPAQPLMISAAAWGMAGLAAQGVLSITLGATDGAFLPAEAVRVALWSALILAALPAAIGEALGRRPLFARRCYFVAIALFFLEGGLRRMLDPQIGQPGEAFFFLAATFIALFGVGIADRTLAGGQTSVDAFSGSGEEETAASLPVSRPHPVRYLEEPAAYSETAAGR